MATARQRYAVLKKEKELYALDDEKIQLKEKLAKVIAFFIDADSCLYHALYRDLHTQAGFVEMTEDEEKNIIDNNQVLLDYIQQIIDANPDDTEFLIGSFSARYSPLIDKLNANINGTSLFYAALEVLVKHLQQKNPNKKIKLDKFLISAVLSEPRPHEEAAFVSDDPDKKFSTTYDKSKLIYLYARLQRLKRDYPKANIDVHLFDDRIDQILTPLMEFFEQTGLKHIPDNITAFFNHYGDDFVSGKNDDVYFTEKVMRLGKLEGKGEPDKNFIQTTIELNNLVNAMNAENLPHLLKINGGFHRFKEIIDLAERMARSSTANIYTNLDLLTQKAEDDYEPWGGAYNSEEEKLSEPDDDESPEPHSPQEKKPRINSPGP